MLNAVVRFFGGLITVGAWTGIGALLGIFGVMLLAGVFNAAQGGSFAGGVKMGGCVTIVAAIPCAFFGMVEGIRRATRVKRDRQE